MMNCKGFGRKRLLGGNEENYKKKLSQYSLSSSRDLNPGPPKYESGSVKHSTTTLGEMTVLRAFLVQNLQQDG
jgi:hypothetical protein